MNPRTLMHYLYPRLLALHDLDEKIALPQMIKNAEGVTVEKILMPACMRASYFYMEAGGVYLIGKHFMVLPAMLGDSDIVLNIYIIDNEEVMIFWVGGSVSPKLLQDLFGVDDINALNPHLVNILILLLLRASY